MVTKQLCLGVNSVSKDKSSLNRCFTENIMKHLFPFVMVILFSLPVNSAEYRLPFVELQGKVIKIPFVEREWTLGAERDEWNLYIENGMLNKRKEIHEFHAVTIYKTPYFSDGLKNMISKIYTYGVLNCKQSALNIFYEWYVDPDETVIFESSYEFGAYTVEMTTPNSARNEIYNQICKESI